MDKKKQAIGVFDSGVGGLSVLKQIVNLLPNEDIYFYGDRANAPYGSKSQEEIIALTIQAVETLMSKSVKAIVIACNTATSEAIDVVREKYPEMLFIGIEPAIKPAVLDQNKAILLLATPMTLQSKRVNKLIDEYNQHTHILLKPMPLLASLIEHHDLMDDEIQTYLKDELHEYQGQVDAVVLGCTHYPFVQTGIVKELGNVKVYDGALGVAKHLKHVLQQHQLLKDDTKNGRIVFESSESNLDIFYKLWNMKIGEME